MPCGFRGDCSCHEQGSAGALTPAILPGAGHRGNLMHLSQPKSGSGLARPATEESISIAIAAPAANNPQASSMKGTARPLVATKEWFRTCSAGHRRIEIEIEIDWFHLTRKVHPIDPDPDFDFDFDFDCHSSACREELTGK